MAEEDVTRAREATADMPVTHVPFMCRLSGRREQLVLLSDERAHDLADRLASLGNWQNLQMLCALSSAERCRAALGTTSSNLAGVLSDQLLNALRPDRDAPINEDLANAALAAMGAIAPRDEIEAMLASQMVATHTAAMDMIGRTRHAEYRHTLQDSGNLAIKLLRTYTAQLEALQRHRGKGQQSHGRARARAQGWPGYRRQRRGGDPGGRVITENRGTIHAKRLTHAPEPTLRCEDQEREAVPVPRSER